MADAAGGLLTLGGRVLGSVIDAIGQFRGPRPIHTAGLRLSGRLRWHHRTAARSGIEWIDDRPSGDVAVIGRLSRGASLPAFLPDIIGLALRVGDDQGDLHRFGELELVSSAGDMDAAVPRFAPMLRPPVGAETCAWTRALREPAYEAGRRGARSPAI